MRRKAISLAFAGLWLISIAVVRADSPEQFATLDGAKIHYESIGQGENTLVFVHGWTCDSGSWEAQRKAFPNQRVILLDLPGHGRSDKPQADYTMPFFARAVEAVMRDAKVERAVLIGHSMGTPVIREFYRLFPEKTAALVIVDGALRAMMPKEQSERFLEKMTADYAQMSSSMVDGMIAPMRDADARARIRASMLGTPDYVAISAMRGMADEKNFAPDPIKVPVLAVLAKSPFWAPDTETFLHSLAPNLQFHTLEGVSHFLMADAPDKFNELVRNFVAKLPGSGQN